MLTGWDGDAVVIIIEWGATSSIGGAIVAMPTASSGSIAPAGGGAINSVASSSGMGSIAGGGSIVAALPTLVVIDALDAIGGGTIVVLVGIATTGSNEITIYIGRVSGEGGEFINIGAGSQWSNWFHRGQA